MADYAGDLTPQETWALLQSDPRARLIDVRTAAEWGFVGGVDLSALRKTPIQVEWQIWPGMALNSRFTTDVTAKLHDHPADAPLAILCRSGARSQSAAKALTAAGFSRCYNITSGFEGALDGQGRRGAVDGWKVAGLPWRQS